MLFIINSYSDDNIYYVNTSALYIREKPDTKSKIINLLPYGTKIYAKKTNHNILYNNTNSNWYELLKNTNGYVLNYYLSNEKTKNSNSYNLFYIPKGYEYGYRSELRLYNNKAILINTTNLYYPDTNIKIGKYELKNNKIIISFIQAYIETVIVDKSIDLINPPKIITINETMKLFWNENIGGFIDEAEIKYINNKSYKLDKTRCIFYDLNNTEDSVKFYSPAYYCNRNTIKWDLSEKANKFIELNR